MRTCVHKVRVFIRVGARTYINIYVYTIFLKKWIAYFNPVYMYGQTPCTNVLNSSRGLAGL
jgi:hypothetical protein